MLAHLGWVLATGTSGDLKYACVKTYSGEYVVACASSFSKGVAKCGRNSDYCAQIP